MKTLITAALVVLCVHTGLSQRSIATLSGITTTKAINGKVFLGATHSVYGTELFVSDGNTGNLQLLKDISPGYGGSNPAQLTVLDDQLFFTCGKQMERRRAPKWSTVSAMPIRQT
jgi:ELWxxDGT repeat protein